MKVKRLDGSSGNAGEQVCCVRIITHEGREVRPDPRNAGRGDSASPEWRRAS